MFLTVLHRPIEADGGVEDFVLYGVFFQRIFVELNAEAGFVGDGEIAVDQF